MFVYPSGSPKGVIPARPPPRPWVHLVMSRDMFDGQNWEGATGI